MKKHHFRCVLSLLICVLLLLQGVSLSAGAATAFDATTFEYALSKVDGGENPGDILVQLYCDTDPDKLITTFGATLVVNTEYVDIVNRKGDVVTDEYKADSVIAGKNFPASAAVIGSDEESFSSIKGLSILSYNGSSREMYIFLAGMAISGIQIAQKSEVASFYLRSKTDLPLPAGTFRVMQEDEIGNECPSKAVMVAEISSTKVIGDTANAISIQAQEGLLEQSTPAPSQASDKTDDGSAQTQPTGKNIADMSEAEIEQEIRSNLAFSETLQLTEAQKNSPEYKAYQKALEQAKDVLDDPDATKEQKAQALEDLREAQEALEQTFPDIAEQTGAAKPKNNRVWLFAGIGAAVLIAAAVIIALILKNKKKATPTVHPQAESEAKNEAQSEAQTEAQANSKEE